jgi:hypothetical protein
VPLGELAQSQTAAAPQPLDILPDPDEKPKGKPKARPRLDVPLPETPRQWRMVGLASVLVFLSAAVFFFIFPVRTVTVMLPTATQQPFVTPVPVDALAEWDWSMPLVTNSSLSLAAGASSIIAPRTIVFIADKSVQTDGLIYYTVYDQNGNRNWAFAFQLEPLAEQPVSLPPGFQPQPRFRPGQRVQVANLDEALANYPAWWWVKRQQFLPEQSEWIYEVQTDGGITLMRSEAQLTDFSTPMPLPTPTLAALPT